MKLNRGTKQNHSMKEKILLASIDLMTKNGINNTSLADIAKEVNISKGTLYYHYSSKDDIIFDIADNHLNIISEALFDCLDRINHHFTTEELVIIVLKNISNIERTGRIHMYLLCEAIIGNDALKERIGLKYVEWRTALEKQIMEIISDKSHAKAASFLLISIVDGLVVQAILKAEKVPYGEIAKFLIDYSDKIKKLPL
ncbi:TetR/AcrR family transcriptional regulator [Terrisporobacter sp.]|uniref:TetR/AcrR family transcriptional regulator n=1 Tax=Terrisporobacter sp. TaxID=1965305 RepID=UPI00261E455E|nr:TetR/AcrR family transcriptional regulator [Terrisporobacter sp.]